MPARHLTLKTSDSTLKFCSESGRLLSFRNRSAPTEEFIASIATHPVFALNYLDQSGEYHRLSSHDAAKCAIDLESEAGRSLLAMKFSRVGGFKLDVTITVRADVKDSFTRWGITVRNDAGLRIVDVQYPYVVASYERQGDVLWPCGSGQLLEKPTPEVLGPDGENAWHFMPENGSSGHYPGGLFAQFLAYFNGNAGIYLACEDSAANVKLIKPLYREPGIRLGMAHVGDWPEKGSRTLEYDVVLRGFSGDWYDAAEIYREWSLRQKWGTPLHRREDIPAWLLDSPAYITLRLQGEVDAGPVAPVHEFLPYKKSLPLLDRLAKRIEAPLVAVLMSWERGAPWVYPDSFPPVGGDAAVKEFAKLARKRGWRVGSFCNGTRWATQHFWNDYDGRAYYAENGGEKSVCRLPDGTPWLETWDRTWRPSHPCCSGAKITRDLALNFVSRLIDWGLESVQFFDQNMGATTFPCFAHDHGHPAVPGKWMATAMREMVEDFKAAADKAGAGEVIQSCESPCNETCLPLFQECDVRVIPPGHTSNYNFLPLYHYLYHECIIIQGGMGMGPEPHHLPTRNACNGVLGELPGAVLTGDGTLLNKDTGNWAAWQPHVGSDDDAMEVMRTVLAMRHGAAHDFLVLGRMQRPAQVKNIKTITWESNGRVNRIPAVFHAAWQAPNGRHGVVLANWTDKAQKASVCDVRLGAEVSQHTYGRVTKTTGHTLNSPGEILTVTVPALGCVLLESLKSSNYE